jgi:tyrosine-protein kinase
LAQEGGLPELVDALRWRWKPALLIALAVIAGAAAYIHTLPSKYDGKTVLSIEPRPNVPTAGPDTVRVIAPKYVAYVTAPDTARRVAAQTQIPAATLEDAVDANVAADTGNLTITVRLEKPAHAAAAANGYADQVLAFSKKDPELMAQLVARAVPPRTPAAPPRKLLYAAAAIVGLILGIGGSLLLERGRPRIRSWRDISQATGYPVLGRVPSTRPLRSRPTEAFADPSTGSAFRTLRANLEPQIRERDLDLLLVTSPEKGDGKTTVAALLAESLGRLGMRTLLIDADLKRPRLARLAGLESTDGLGSVLRGDKVLDEAIQRGWTDDLALLLAAEDPEAGDLLARNFADVLRTARGTYDVVVVDAPPLIGTDDARTMAPQMDGVLLVVSAGSTAATLHEAVLALESLKAPLLGVIGNRLKEARNLYY